MDIRGYNAILSALEDIPASATPVPEIGVNERYVTVHNSVNVSPAVVLSVLQKAGLMASEGPSDLGEPVSLRPISAVPGSATFEDLKFPANRLW